VEVPLALADIGYSICEDTKRAVIAVVLPEREEDLVELSDELVHEAWVIDAECAPNGTDSIDADAASDAFRVLSAMCMAGAARSDLWSLVDVDTSVIGRGYASTVYKGASKVTFAAMASGLPQEVAVKVMHKPEDNEERSSSRKLRDEVGILLQVHQHPNIVGYLGLFSMRPLPAEASQEDGATAFWEHAASSGFEPTWAVMMEYCPGDLFDRVVGGGAYNQGPAAVLVCQLLSAISHIHSIGIVHRDIKAENVLIMGDGTPRLADFGIAARLSDWEEMDRRPGSPGYVAPEVLAGHTCGCEVDTFGIGVIFFFVLSVRLPFAGGDVTNVLRRNLRCKVKFEGKRWGSITSETKWFITELLRKHPQDRPSTQAAMRDLEAWRRQNPEQVDEKLSDGTRSSQAAVDDESAHAVSTLGPCGARRPASRAARLSPIQGESALATPAMVPGDSQHGESPQPHAGNHNSFNRRRLSGVRVNGQAKETTRSAAASLREEPAPPPPERIEAHNFKIVAPSPKHSSDATSSRPRRLHRPVNARCPVIPATENTLEKENERDLSDWRSWQSTNAYSFRSQDSFRADDDDLELSEGFLSPASFPTRRSSRPPDDLDSLKEEAEERAFEDIDISCLRADCPRIPSRPPPGQSPGSWRRARAS